MLRIAYITGLSIGPFALLIAAYVVNASGPEQCRARDDIALNGRLVVVEQCTGRLGLSVREPIVIAR